MTLPINQPSGPLNLIEYGDFSCPRCRELAQLLTSILPQFDGEVCYTFRHFPDLSHPSALLMALAAEAARRQNQYAAMHRELFAQTSPASAAVSLRSMAALASGLGLDMALFLNDMHGETLKNLIWADRKQGRLAGVVSAPTLFLGIRRLHGKFTQARLIPLMRHYADRKKNLISLVARQHELARWSGMG
jgi:protein-disulfide isomerase